jgi:hypothetical protein
VSGSTTCATELALGTLAERRNFLRDPGNLPHAVTANEPEFLELIEAERLHGRGNGYLDVHLPASARLSGAKLWTQDRRLAEVAAGLGVEFSTG